MPMVVIIHTLEWATMLEEMPYILPKSAECQKHSLLVGVLITYGLRPPTLKLELVLDFGSITSISGKILEAEQQS